MKTLLILGKALFNNLFTARRPALATFTCTLAWLVWSAPAAAYPTSIIFVPTGTTVGPGQGNMAFYNAYYGDISETWTGLNVGLLPEFPYGATGLVFPGLEVGLDAIAMPGDNPGIKAIANAKLGLVREAGWIPDLALGYMSWAFLNPDRSLNMAYLSATKSFLAGERELGRGTIGLGHSSPAAPDLFGSTWPLTTGNQTLMVGYEFPAVGPFTFAMDHVGGNTEVSGTNFVLNVELVPGTFASLGYAFSHERDDSYPDGYFLQTYTNFDLLKAFGPPAEEPAAAAGM